MRDTVPCGQRVGNAVWRNGDSERRNRRHRRVLDLNLGAALIAGGAMLQAGVSVDHLGTLAVVIRLREGHEWRRRSLDAGLRKADRLGE